MDPTGILSFEREPILTVKVKICGLQDAAAVDAAIEGGASFLGFVFCANSRHCASAVETASMMQLVPSSILSTGLFVDPSDDELTSVLRVAPLRLIQLHGAETVDRVVAVKKLTGLPVIKAIGIAAPTDIERVRLYEQTADFLLLDAKPRPGGPSGGNGIAFDWSLLKNAAFSKPWMLAGGLNEENINEAVAATGAQILDVSSGVEDASGHKSPEKVKAFLKKAQQL